MRKCVSFCLCTLFLLGCYNSKNDSKSEVNSSSVDLSSILQAYEKNNRLCDVSYTDEVYQVLCPYDDCDTTNSIDIEIYDDKPFTLDLADYRTSKHPFLCQAEDIFNCCLIANGIWSNFEVWERFYDIDDKTIAKDISKIDVQCIKDEELRQASLIYRDGMSDLLSRAEEAIDEDITPYTLRESYIQTINDKWYKYYEDSDSFSNVITEKYDSISAFLDKSYNRYLNTTENERLGQMLNFLNTCNSFDEQCVLFCKWADSEDSSIEDMWIIAVGTRLMESKRYSPFLFKVWQIWRPLCQSMYFGLSRDSEIPNKLYNDYRARCYITCLQYIETHPNDILAMNCASVLAGQRNINRYGIYSLGNQSAIESLELLPNRYKKVFEDEEEQNDSTQSNK